MVPGDTEGQLCVNYTSHSLDVSLTYHDWSAVPNAGGFVCTGSGCLDAQIRSMASLAEKLDRVIIQHPEAIMTKNNHIYHNKSLESVSVGFTAFYFTNVGECWEEAFPLDLCVKFYFIVLTSFEVISVIIASKSSTQPRSTHTRVL